MRSSFVDEVSPPDAPDPSHEDDCRAKLAEADEEGEDVEVAAAAGADHGAPSWEDDVDDEEDYVPRLRHSLHSLCYQLLANHSYASFF
eukprot:CAMPEP_0202971820 /NCGR_PEP_ID=MMETSP1396-20130829/31159_1 /ASSEMBLY_ACC=CAM_ASM_000872 /TAXON_ID= /ORGANISM="Pseudokeronopsis sp., Strain Brazil" /LENGTH=87 /DNA_ID=CAMNT_0049701623 /DNA_START=48 /DNA_END=309 /DNA_ORIENTATION=-